MKDKLIRALLFTLLLTLPMLASPRLHAQEDPIEVASQLVELAAKAYSEGDFEAAASWLEKAYSLDPDPIIAFNLARAQSGAGQLDAARETLLKLQQDPELMEELVPRVKVELTRLDNLTKGTMQYGQLSVRTTPSGAKVYIDGVRAEQSSPLAKNLELGEHTLLIVLDGYQSVEQGFKISKEQATDIDLVLTPVGGAADDGISGIELAAYTCLGLGVVGVAVGVATYFPAASKYDEWETTTDEREAASLSEDGKLMGTISTISYGVGFSALGVGTALLIYALVGDDEESAWQPSTIAVDARGQLSVGWTF
ncbi:MAG: PEGA domain-containing protein [Myxococcota bacterium]|jgi:tetratricopeptide (TPR) repeat protein|nr:PEGA domain-containing protein [Myxococcota bacterium]